MRINKVARKGEAANMIGVQRVGGLEERDTKVIKARDEDQGDKWSL